MKKSTAIFRAILFALIIPLPFVLRADSRDVVSLLTTTRHATAAIERFKMRAIEKVIDNGPLPRDVTHYWLDELHTPSKTKHLPGYLSQGIGKAESDDQYNI